MGNIYIVIICFPGFDVINFEIYLSFLIKWFSNMTKTEQKFKYRQERKKAFSSFLRGFQLSRIVSDLRVWLRQRCIEVSVKHLW